MNNPTLPARAARLWGVLPLSKDDDGSIRIAATDPDDKNMLANVAAWFGAPVIPVKWSQAELEKALVEAYGFGADSVELLSLPFAVGQDGMSRFVDDLMIQAQKDRATDIHIEPFEDDVFIRFRIDGLLHLIPVPPSLYQFRHLLISRIKVMAKMDIAENRQPQDGRMELTIDGETLDIRVSTIPTIHGENLDLRLLPRDRMMMGLEELGMTEEHLEKVNNLIKKPNGIFLVTGPTGHGKTTTLYACLSQINTPDKKIITLEDPVEYQLKGVSQMQVHPKIGLDFSSGLRSILRQDPDVIMVGEIRDTDTAEMAVRASLTGHLVFSTLHTTDATGAIVRLIDMGIEPYLVASSLQAVLAQRLIRLLCLHCGGKGINCDKCRRTGFRRRMGIFELLLINDELRQLIQDRVPIMTLRRRALDLGMRTLFQEGSKKVKQAFTTIDEVLRVTEEN